MADAIHLSDSIRRQLQAALVREPDLLQLLEREEPEELDGLPGRYRCRCTLPVPRPMDPETAELRSLDIYLRRRPIPGDGDGWEVYEVDGLQPVQG